MQTAANVVTKLMDANRDRIDIGSAVIHRLADMEDVTWPAAAVFRDLPPSVLQRAAETYPTAIDAAANALKLTFNSYIIKTPDYLCLIDAGLGNNKERLDRPLWHRRNGDFLERLKALGYAPEQFDIVINTHLHADHVGWNTVMTDGAWVPTFRNARYIVPAIELANGEARYQTDSNALHGAFADSVQPIIAAGRYRAVDLPCEIAPGLWLEPAPGHTLGMATVRLRGESRDVLFLADAIHSPMQLATPDLTSNFCVDPAQSRATRHRLLDACAGTNTIVATYHFPPPVFGHIVRSGSGYSFEPIT
ncbi:MBL fold metallo-hydrolase [Pseudorhodoplanes sinuspersici]|uniref:Uncharacterized protein n=1 Tax=Pseudorhodoplanes sinuspersici TaxID=1235591 RepID=A0A1W6ZY99_9HYPH|nr:MBL fold metallo-hydrolase [Pseudorhodoplanes sinuspersici]ARQ02389.1 hypothetical protein CAK95_27235 [Pseudorhodoplanes sinuspersici]RKE74219.1 glyoxylase-like metal-dependent hydrolase (beta-lactamase superfamily II) [Pseudorhodoplanes sinuspersici]